MMDPDRGMQHKREATRDSLEVIMQRSLTLPLLVFLKPPKSLKPPEGYIQVLRAFFRDVSEMFSSPLI